MRKLFNILQESDNPQLLNLNQFFLDSEDLQQKNPEFYEYLIKHNIEIKPEDFPFSLKKGSEGIIFDKESKILIVKGETAVDQLYGNTAAGHQGEVKRDYDIVIEEPDTYVMFATNGCKLSDAHYTLLKNSCRSIKKIGYGLPIKPEDLVSDLLKIPNAYVMQYGETTDYKDEPQLTVLVTFDKKSLSEKFDASELLPNHYGIYEYTLYPTRILRITKEVSMIINKSEVLKNAFYDYAMNIITLMHDDFIDLLIKETNISTYLTKDEIQDWQQYNMADLLQQGLLGKINSAIDDSLRAIGPSIKIRLLRDASPFYVAIIRLYNEMQNPQSNWDEALLQMALLKLYTIPANRPQSGPLGRVLLNNLNTELDDLSYKIREIYTTDAELENMEELSLKVIQTREAIQKAEQGIITRTLEGVAKFRKIAEKEFQNHSAITGISPLYSHYEIFVQAKEAAKLAERKRLEAERIENERIRAEQKEVHPIRVNFNSYNKPVHAFAGSSIKTPPMIIPKVSREVAQPISRITTSLPPAEPKKRGKINRIKKTLVNLFSCTGRKK